MSCNCCFEDWICKCTPYDSFISVNATLPADTEFLITDKFDNVYRGPVTQDGAQAQIMLNLLPDGFFTEFSGPIKIQFVAQDSNIPIDFILQQVVDCIDVTVKGGNNNKQDIGEPYPT